MEITRALEQTACSALNVFFDMVELTISAVKFEAMVFSRKHHKPDVTLWIDGRSFSQTKEFKYLGVLFDFGIRWSTQVRYVQKRCLQILNFMRSIAGTWWDSRNFYYLMLAKFYFQCMQNSVHLKVLNQQRKSVKSTTKKCKHNNKLKLFIVLHVLNVLN
jgi:hypothetical protein